MTGLVLEGGGARGSYHVGAIKAFKKRKIKFDGVVGTSIGSINAAFIVSNKYKQLLKIWQTTKLEELFEIDEELIKDLKQFKFNKNNIKKGFSTIVKIVKNNGIDTKILRHMLEENIDEKALRKSNLDFGLATYNVTDIKPIKIFKEDIPKGKLVEYIMASAYYPAFKFEKIIDDKFYIDGGVFDRCPIDMLLDKGYDNIYVIRAYRNKIHIIKENNIKITMIQSRKSLGSVIMFDHDRILENIKMGYYDTLRILDKLDGRKYYIKKRNKQYYSKLFSKNIKSKIMNKYSKLMINKEEKNVILSTIEIICTQLDIKMYKIYSVPILTLILKFKIKKLKRTKYYDFVKNIKVRFI